MMTQHSIATAPSATLGFTLVEVVLYMAFTTVIVLVSGAYLLDVLHMKTKLQTERSLTQSAYFLQHALQAQIDQADIIVAPSIGETANTFVVVDNLSTTSVSLSQGTVLLSTLTGDLPLTARDLEVRDLLFVSVGVTGAPSAIRVEGLLCAREYPLAATTPECLSFHWLFTRRVSP